MILFEYVTALTLADLTNSLSVYIQDGWKFQGGIAFDGELYIQLMVKITIKDSSNKSIDTSFLTINKHLS